MTPPVTRYSTRDPVTGLPSGDFIQVGSIDLGSVHALVTAEYQRAKAICPRNPAFAMRPMWFTGSPFGAEILELANMEVIR